MEIIWQWGLSLIMSMQHYREPALDGLMRALTFMGGEQFYLLLLPFLLWCVDFGMAVRLGVIFLLSVEANGSIKDALQQPRPFDFNPVVKLASGEGYGLPSGHAQSAVVVWGSIAAWARRGWVWLAAIDLIFLIGISRIYLGVHFPTDVLAGWAIGAGLLGLYAVARSPGLRLARRLGLSAQVIAAIVLPIALAMLHPTKDDVSAMGTLAGFGTGLVFASRFVSFSARGPWWQRALRFVAGGIIVAVLYVGLRAIFPVEGSPFYFAFRFLRFGLIGLWATLGAPRLFVKLRLARQGG